MRFLIVSATNSATLGTRILPPVLIGLARTGENSVADILSFSATKHFHLYRFKPHIVDSPNNSKHMQIQEQH